MVVILKVMLVMENYGAIIFNFDSAVYRATKIIFKQTAMYTLNKFSLGYFALLKFVI